MFTFLHQTAILLST